MGTGHVYISDAVMFHSLCEGLLTPYRRIVVLGDGNRHQPNVVCGLPTTYAGTSKGDRADPLDRNSRRVKLFQTDHPARKPGTPATAERGVFCEVYTTSLSLLQRLREPSEKLAWDRFVLLYTPLILQWAGKLGLREPEASDLVQEVFLLLVRKLRQFHYRPDQRFRGWLWTVTLNKFRELRRRRPDLPISASGNALENVVAPDVKDGYEETEYRQYLIERALQLMHEDFQPAVWKACWECVVGGRAAKDVAQELGMSLNAVYLAKSRVLRRLHQELSGLID